MSPPGRGESLPQVEEFTYLDLLLQSDGAGDGLTYQGLLLSTGGVVAVRRSEERAETKGKALDLLVYAPTLTCGHEVWIRA